MDADDLKRRDGLKRPVPAYSKEQLLFSERYREKRDLIEALLEDGGSYTIHDVDKKVDEYLKGKVN